MPRIADNISDCAIYLYQSEMDAKEGDDSGGSGCLVTVPFGIANPVEAVSLFRKPSERMYGHIYAVTNCHVIDDGFTVVRLNTKDGKSKPIPITESKWVRYRNGDDLAVAALDLESEIYQFQSLSTDLFITGERFNNFGIGMGDDTLMVGRFINRKEKQFNTPVARFGHLSAPRAEYIEQDERGKFQQESCLVECHSISGFSGSPVFVDVPEQRRQLGSFKEAARTKQTITLTIKENSAASDYFLLGIDWGHLAGGMAAVVPAWRLLDLLFDDRLIAMRKDKEAATSRKGGARLDSASADREQDRKKTRDVEIPPISRKKFFDALGKATKRKSP